MYGQEIDARIDNKAVPYYRSVVKWAYGVRFMFVVDGLVAAKLVLRRSIN